MGLYLILKCIVLDMIVCGRVSFYAENHDGV